MKNIMFKVSPQGVIEMETTVDLTPYLIPYPTYNTEEYKVYMMQGYAMSDLRTEIDYDGECIRYTTFGSDFDIMSVQDTVLNEIQNLKQ